MWAKVDADERRRVLGLIIARAWVQQDHLCAVMLRPNYLVWLQQASQVAGANVEPAELPPFLQKENGNLHIMGGCHCGSDGRRIGMWHSIAISALGDSHSFPAP